MCREVGVFYQRQNQVGRRLACIESGAHFMTGRDCDIAVGKDDPVFLERGEEVIVSLIR
ncbi:hypothetical protein L841_1358 [Mycobacterium sp. MAC_080597_8934]|nr:hypothetical protein L840_4332 [Mycobacterium sp. MAC_011194_8550]ETZ69155.1 hypothetical protein L841_1358 [Mycobacterium sp. MAC_080597_8934]